MKKMLSAGNRFRIAITALLFSFTFLHSSLLQAADFEVTNGNNAGAGSLRQAILDANASAAVPHTISFTVSGIINITSSLPTITRQVTIDGGNAVTISGPGGNNYIALLVLGTGSGGSTIRNLAMRNTGLEPIRLAVALSGITIENMVLTQTGAHYMNRAILANAAVTNLTVRNVVVTGLEDNMQGIYFGGNVTNVMIDSFHISGGSGGTAKGIHIQGVTNGLTIKNSVFDLDDPATADDGSYGIYFTTTASNVTIDSSIIRDCEVYGIYCGAAAVDFNIKNSQFDNLDGWTRNKFVYFKTNINGVTVDKNIFNAKYRTGANDGDFSLVMAGAANQSVTITDNQFIENDTLAIFFGGNTLANNHDNVLIQGNAFHRNGCGASVSGGIDFLARNTASDAGPILITENTFSENNGFAIIVRPGNATTYLIPNFTISKNIIYNTKSSLGTIRVNYINKIIITQNSIYNNQAPGIDVAYGNCEYEGANTPQIVSSVETGTGVYDVTVKMPSICGAGNCSIELFSNEAGIKGIGGQHYVTTISGLPSGNQVLTGITGSFAEITGAPYGTWSATLRVTNNCGTSEFGNKIAIKPNGPAGISNGIAVWLRGDELSVNNAEPTASGLAITGWEEFSGGGGPSSTYIINNPLTKLNGINFNPVADMDGDGIRGHLSGAPSWITSSTVTSVAVFNPLSASASGDRFYCLFSQAGSDYNTNKAQIEFYRTGNNINSYRGSTLLNPPIPGTSGVKAFDRPGVFTSVTSASAHTSYYNGSNMGSGNYNKGAFAISQWFVGTGWNTTDGWQGGSETDFAEVFTYNRVLSAIELQKVQSYMALKYGIAMKQNYVLSDGTPVWDVTANATYSKEIAALVRDNLSVLHQKQAKAFHADELLSIAVGSSLAATNKDNEDSVVNNLSAFIWGNDSASTAYTSAFSAGTYSTTRMHRVWKVQKINWADKDITIKVNNAKSNNYLLVSTDPAFASITQELPFANDGTITVSSTLLADGNYFTIGRQQKAPGGVAPGLEVWTKADEGVTMSGANVTAWQDQGSSQRVWPRANTGAIGWSASSFNYNPVVQFTAVNYFRVSQFTPFYTQGEIFSVQSSTVNNVVSFPWQMGGGADAVNVHYRWTNDNMYLHFGVAARRNFSFAPKNMALPAILDVSSAANTWTASLDGRVMSGPTSVTTSFAQAPGLTYNYIGAGHNSVFNGLLPEVILYNRKLNTTERSQVNSYLALKYGITIDQTTATDYLASDGSTTMWKASDNTGFTTNIAGIGRDDIGTLYQKQSRSINTVANGNLIAIAVGNELVASNADNTDTITNNKSFLVWADNNAAVTYTTNITGGNVTVRMPRVWKVDKTNWADRAITIKLHGSATNTYLLISNSDATFATIDQELSMNADSTITIGSDLLPDGAYFTFGKQITGPGFVNTGVLVWLRADDGVSANDAWYDYSGNDFNAAQATISSQPVKTEGVANFNPAYSFDGTDDYMDFASTLSLSGTNPFTVVGLGMREPISTWDAFLSQQGNTTGGFLFGIDATNRSQIHRTGTGLTLQGTATNNLLNFPYLVTATRSGNNFALYNNGAADGTITSTHSYNISNIRLGNRLTSADLAFAGKIPEVIVYNRALAAFELKKVHSYLALKYGVSLSQTIPADYVATDWNGTTGTKIWTAAKNGAYNNNIAGIGRDDKTALYQKQSRSASDTLITIAVGNTIAADNTANATVIDDMSFFTWADNAGAATFSVAVTSVANATARMAKVWKVDRTNWTDQDITLKAIQGGDRYLLIHATDAGFGAGTVEYALNTSTGSVTINTANLPDGAFFTLATKIVGPACVNNGIATWLKTDYAAASNSWVDFSGNQTNAAQANAANQPDLNTAGLNFNPSLVFNGSTDNLVIPNSAITGKYPFGASARTVIGVGATNIATTSYGMMLAYGSNGAGTGLYIGQGNGTSIASFGGYNSATYNLPGTANSMPLNNTRIIGGRYTGTTARLDVNGALNASLTTTWNTTAAQPAYVGVGVTGTQYWNGKLGEIIVYNRELTTDELLRVNSYLALKYGITLDQTTATDYIASNGVTLMWSAADNAGYNKRITGIGRDDCTELYQKQSLSVDTGIVIMAIGDVVETSNQLNAAAIANDNSYLVFADDGASVQYNTPVSGPGEVTTRMTRTWKVDKTNWADAGVTFKLTDGNEKIYMIVSSDAAFDGADAAYQLDAEGSVNIPTDLLPDGAYFTFAKALKGPGYVNIGVQLWLRADDDVSTVDTWNDYSGNDNHATQATAANQSVFTGNSVNYNPAYDFNGTATWMATTQIPAASFVSNSYFVMHKPTTIAGGRDYLSAASSASSIMEFRQGAASYEYLEGTPTVVVAAPANSVVANLPFLAGATQATGSNNVKVYQNGQNVATGTINMTMPNSDVTFELGRRHSAFGATNYFQGGMNEIVAYNRVLNREELARVNSYLSLKYGLTYGNGDSSYVATDWDGLTGTVYWTANVAYRNNIAGIGRDDKTALYQKQSRSVNTANNGNMVAIGIGSIAATNKDNTNTIADDLSFLVWGDNGATGTKLTEYPAALDPGACSKITRLQREWKVQVTGNPGSVQLQLYLTGLIPNSTGQSDLKLLIDDDGDFSSGVTTIVDPSSYDGTTQVVTFNDISFSNSQYFTVVTDLTNQAPGGVLTNLYTWYRADKGVTASTGVSLQADQSVSAKDAAQATAAAQPLYNTAANLINFNPTLGFDGSNDVLSNTTISHSAAANGEDIFAVVFPNPAAVSGEIVSFGTVANTGTTTEFRFNTNRLEYLSTSGGTVPSITSSGNTNGMVQLANANRSSAGAASIIMNGTTAVTGIVNHNPSANQINIGARRYGGGNAIFFNGQVAEVAVYNRQLTATEREKVESYFAIKYGITLTHNYVDPAGNIVWDATANAGYGYNMTGIGRDDCNGLHQKQSKSVNTAEALITLGNYTGIAVSNAANVNSMDNATALLLGDDNGNRAAWTATGAPLNRERLARTWKVQETGNIGTVTIQVPSGSSSAAVKLPLEKDGVAYLLVSASGDFENDVTEIPMTLNGTDWEATWDFSSGQYFTFATNNECVSASAELTTYGAVTTAATDKCYVNGWILFKDPLDDSKYIAAIYDPSGLIDQSKITASVNVNTAFADLGEGNASQASRLMRRMLQVDCADCYDAVANPNPGFTVRMFYAPDEKAGAENAETNSMAAIKTANSLVDPHSFIWFKAAGKTVVEVVSELSPAGIHAGGQEWVDGALPTGQQDGVDYVDFTAVDGFSTFGGVWVVNVTGVLPVTWVDVQALPAGNNSIRVSWITADELNNAGFVVERSQDGLRYQEIAAVAAQTGNTGTAHYSVNDNNVSTGITYYYRIRQTDITGRISYSKIVTAKLNTGQQNHLRIWPNPVSGTLNWSLYTSRSQYYRVMVMDAIGKNLVTAQLSAQAGYNNFTLDVAGFRKGAYLLRMVGEDGTVYTERFVVQ